MILSDRTSCQWFEEAVRSYVDAHQGCPWCARSHCVYQVMDEDIQTFTCQGCDFQVSFDPETGRYHHIVGVESTKKCAETMFEV